MAASGAYAIRMKVDIVWVGAGEGGMTQATSQVLSLFPTAPGNNASSSATGLPNVGMGQIVPVPGGNAPTAANFQTAMNNATADIDAQIAANLTRIQNFATGGG